MAFFRRLWTFLIGDLGPADIEVTRGSDGVRFRLPGQTNDREFWTPWLAGALFVGPILLLTSIRAALELPPEEHNVGGTIMCLLSIVGIMFSIVCKWRVTWRYELLLTPNELIVEYLATHKRRVFNPIAAPSIRQLTIVRYSRSSNLHAECADDSLLVVLSNQDHERVERLAHLLADEYSRMRAQPAWPVKTETPGDIRVERDEPPLNAKIVLTRTETGVAFDFPMPEDRRTHLRRRAWRWFEVGIFLLIGCVITVAVGQVMQWPEVLNFLPIPFFFGLVCLMAGASDATTAWSGTGGDEDLRQLGVAGNLLIRTTRDHNKRIWYGHEIADISIEIEITDEGPNVMKLALRLHVGGPIVLYGPFGDDSHTDYRLKALLEWIATVLRHALKKDTHEPPAGPAPDGIEESISHAIQDRTSRALETRIS